MTIKLPYFCTKTGKIYSLPNGDPIEREIEHCLAEYFTPNAEFKLGVVYPGVSQPEDLKQHEGLSLEFSHHDQFFFMSENLRDEMMDEPSLGAAYGSNFFTPLEYMAELPNLKILVVDWQTGENATVIDPSTGEERSRLPRDVALQLVGEGDGRIDNRIHTILGNPPNTQFQFRAGIKKQENCPVNQFLKGTMAPLDLKATLAPYFPDGKAPDLIVSTDQLKGRKNKDNPLGILDPVTKKPVQVGNAIKPGEYTLTIGIGKTKDARLHASSTGAQVLNAVGEAALPDVASRQVERLYEIEQMLGDPRKVALDYIELYERRQQYRDTKELDETVAVVEDWSPEELSQLNQFLENFTSEIDDDKFVRLLKADLAGHLQIMEMPIIANKLSEHCQEQLRDCALGRFLKFESSMALSCRVLKENEVCIPHLKDGEEVIVYRPPVSSSNVMAVLTNRHIEGDPLNPMRGDSILLHPQTAAQLKIDKDGDEPIFAPASDYCAIADEIERRNQPSNRYAETVTPPKAKYEKMSFEEIALSAMNNSVGRVANQTMKAIALESECRAVNGEEKESFLRELSGNFNAKSEVLSSVPEECNLLNDGRILSLLSLHNRFSSPNYQDNPLTPIECDRYIALAESTFKDVVSILANQLEIEVQSGKSANRANPEVLKFCHAVCSVPVHWLEDRKLDEVYVNRAIRSNTHGIIDSLVQATNEVFNESALLPRRISQFGELFKDVEYTEEIEAKTKEYRDEYNQIVRDVSNIKKEIESLDNEPYLKLVATSLKGNNLEVALTEKDLKHSQIFDLPQLTNVMLIRDEDTGKWKVTAAVIDLPTGKPQMKEDGKTPLRKQIGYLTDKSYFENSELLKEVAKFQGKDNFLDLKTLNIDILPGYTKQHEEAIVSMLAKKAQEIYNSIPEGEKLPVAAAMWKMSTRQSNDPRKSIQENLQMELKNRASAAFAICHREIEKRLDSLQFDSLTIIGTQKDLNEWKGREWTGEKVEIDVELLPHPGDSSKLARWVVADGKKLGILSDESPQLPPGAKATAEITSAPSSGLQLTSRIGNSLKVSHVSRYAYKDTQWQGEEVQISIHTQAQKNDPTKLTGFATINGKKLGIIERESFEVLRSKLERAGYAVEGYTIPMTVSYALANNATVSVDKSTVTYPDEWMRDNLSSWQLREKKSEMLFALKPVLGAKYPTPVTLDLLNDENTSHTEITVNQEFFTALEETRGKTAPMLASLTQEIQNRFATRCFVQRSTNSEQKELYFCVDLTGLRNPDWITENLKFPYEYDSMKNGVRERYMAIPLSELGELVAAHYNPASVFHIEPSREEVNLSDSKTIEPKEPKIKKPVEISGKPIPMVFPLKLHGQPNALPVDSCIEAMRGYGRCHTTRAYNPYKVYGFKEGDIALAVAGDKNVAFRVGKQYRITRDMISDPQYRQQWAEQEKHHEQELWNFTGKPEVWGLCMEPLGDYKDGNIVPFPEPSIKPVVGELSQPGLSAEVPKLNDLRHQSVLVAERLNELMNLKRTSLIIGGKYVYERSLDPSEKQILFTAAPKGEQNAPLLTVIQTADGWDVQNALPEGHTQAIADSLVKLIDRAKEEQEQEQSSPSPTTTQNNSETRRLPQSPNGNVAPKSGVREPWEREMLNQAQASIGKMDGQYLSSTFSAGDKEYKVMYTPQEKRLTITRKESQEIIWSASKGQPATINCVQERDKSNFLNAQKGKGISNSQQPKKQKDSGMER